jgi:hypothetical protein
MSEVRMTIEELHAMDKRLSLLEQKVDTINDNLKKLTDSISFLAKVFGAGVLGAIVTWIVRGGMAS